MGGFNKDFNPYPGVWMLGYYQFKCPCKAEELKLSREKIHFKIVC